MAFIFNIFYFKHGEFGHRMLPNTRFVGCQIPDLDIVFADNSFNSGGCLWH
jgi:hypothetical protein